MSKIGKKPVPLAKGVELKWQAPLVRIKGPKGELTLTIRPEVDLEVSSGEVKVKAKEATKQANSLHGTYRSLINNMIIGVSQGFERKLEMVGVGYKAELKGKALAILAGFSHPVEYSIPAGIEITVEKGNKIAIKGIDKHLVGEVAAQIRSIRPPEPYQGKGIRYEGELVRKKAGKAAAGVTSGTAGGK